MCGIVGWLSPTGIIDSDILQSMTDALSHRGPDAAGMHIEGMIGLGHRRLSIIDTAETANQPMHDVDGSCVLIFNGEIYNFRELRDDLERHGHRFRTRSDTEVILETYKRHGPSCVEYFNGMFAFALWDFRQRRLFLARDRAGEKPLFYAQTSAGFVFASEPRALRRHPDVSRDVDPSGLAKYLAFNYVPGDGTLYAAIRKLPPASTMTVDADGRLEIRPYWTLAPHYGRDHGFRNEAEAEEALRALIDDATRMRMVSDVPLGAFLSSGIDSATIVAAMTQSAADVRSFSIGFDADGFDEADDARQTANALGVIHSEERLDLDPAAMIAATVHAADEPLADNSALPTWLLSRFTRRHVTVALSGDGGDELFGGYETYLADRLARPLASVPGPFWRAAARMADQFLPVSFNKVSWDYKARHFLRGLSHGWPGAHGAWRTIFDTHDQVKLLRPEVRLAAACDLYEDTHAAYAEVPGTHFLNRAMFTDIRTWMADDILVKVDRMAMAHGLEVRAPFLDHRIMELAASLPSSWKLKGRRTKHILKESQRNRLPPAVLARRKLGFNAPMSHWLLGPLRPFARERLASSTLDNWVSRQEVDRLWEEHESHRRDNGFKLFGLMTLSAWLDMD